MDLLGSALNGLNSCLFAYGNRGTGKSYSLFGDQANPGVVFLAVDQLFQAIEEPVERLYEV